MKCAGVLAPASPWRTRLVPRPAATTEAAPADGGKTCMGDRRPWVEVLKRLFGVDALACAKCKGRLKLLAVVTDPASVRRDLSALGENVDVPVRTPGRGPPSWKSTVLRRNALGAEA